MQTDFRPIIGSNIKFSERVCIVAPGLNGRDFFQKIPADFQRVAVSKAIEIEEINPSVWVMNPPFVNRPWFSCADKKFNGVRVFRRSMIDHPEFQKNHPFGGYYFDPSGSHEEKLDAVIRRPLSGVIRGGATVSGCAIQIAYNLGAKEIVLCGVDMSGDQYWDRTINQQKDHGDVWAYAPALQNLINTLMEDCGIKISTLSPTKLCIPEFK